ncbi:MAG TPA: hypothetical protein VKB25_09570 [Conexibacter sp.]|nr:hypothetical protein [Conexibacter sp.]
MTSAVTSAAAMVVCGPDAPGGVCAADVAGCPGCGAPLAGDERFCLACGLRLAPDELRLAALPWAAAYAAVTPALGGEALGGQPAFRRPHARSAAITAVVVLACGVAIGATIGPAAVSQTAAAQRPVLLVSVSPTPIAAASADEAAPTEDTAGGDPADEVQSLADIGTSDGADAAADPAAETPAAAPPSDDEGPAGEDPADDGSGDDGATPPAAAPPGSQPLAGVVVASAADGEGFVLAARDGRLLHVHASNCGVALGDDLHLRARPLANGTWSADRVRRVAAGVGEARVAGTVAWVDPERGRYALGARGVTLLVAVSPPAAPAPPPATSTVPAPVAPAAGQTQPASPPPMPESAIPVLGARLLVRVAPTPAHDGQAATLVEQARRDAPPAADPAAPVPPLELAGVVQAVDPQARTLTVALDPDAQPPLTVTLSVPPQVDAARLLPAQRVAVTATAAPDGTLALSGVSPDDDALAADDPTAFQGDQRTGAPPDGDQTTTTVATCTSLDAAVRTATGRKKFTTPPPDRNDPAPKHS